MNKDEDKKIDPLSIDKTVRIKKNLELFNQQIKEESRSIKKLKSEDSENEHIQLNFLELHKIKMTEAVGEIIALYKIDAVTKNLPTFDGNRNELYHFINSVDNIISTCDKIKRTPSYEVILSNIRNKITGHPSQSLTTHNIPSTDWAKIKKHLIATYADTRDEANLQFELYSLIKENLEPKILYDKIQNLLTLLSNQIRLHQDNDEIIAHQINQYQKTGLIIFQAGLREPLGGRLRSSQPKDLTEALDFITKEQNINKLKFSNQTTSRWHSPNRVPSRNFANQTYTSRNFQYNQNTQNSRPPVRNNYNTNYNSNFHRNTANQSYTPRPNYQKVIPKADIKQEKTSTYNIETVINDEDFQMQASEEI